MTPIALASTSEIVYVMLQIGVIWINDWQVKLPFTTHKLLSIFRIQVVIRLLLTYGWRGNGESAVNAEPAGPAERGSHSIVMGRCSLVPRLLLFFNVAHRKMEGLVRERT